MSPSARSSRSWRPHWSGCTRLLAASYDPNVEPRRFELDHLPGHELVLTGIEDLRHGRRSAEALLVAIGAARLRAGGLDLPAIPAGDRYPEHELYELLAGEDHDAAHGRYNALIRRLVSFERALERAQTG
jgi:hypothetical protein